MTQPAYNALSVKAAAAQCPDGTALLDFGQPVSYAQMAREVDKVLAALKRPAPGRPYILEARSDKTTLITLYALWEARIPVLLLHPALTPYEREALLADIALIDTPLPDDTVAVLFTSGTTGRPKPAVISRRAMLASARSNALNLAMTPDDRWLLSISPARIGGLSILSRSLLARSTVVIDEPFNPATYPGVLRRRAITLTSLVPTMLIKCLQANPDFNGVPTLRSLLLGGATASEALLKRARDLGIPVMTTYGMTETASNVVTTPYAERLTGAVGSGRPNPGATVTVDNNEIIVSGDMCMSGYWGKAPVDASVGFKTGDLGYFDDRGYLHVQARRTDLIVSGGENVYPAEVEAALDTIDGIAASLVVGLPDEVWGHIVTALLVPVDGPIPQSALIEALKMRLSLYKCPRRIAWVKEIPTRPGGKPLRSDKALDGLELIKLHYKS